MKVLHEVITDKAYQNALKRSDMNHQYEKPAILFYGKGRYDDVTYMVNDKIEHSKCSFVSNDVIPFDLDLKEDQEYFFNSRRTFLRNLANGHNHSVNICEVDENGNYVRTVDESEVLELYEE